MAIKRTGKGFGFEKTMQNYKGFKSDTPKRIANNSRNHFLMGFRKGGGQTNTSKGGWLPRDPKSKRNTGRGILINTGALRRNVLVLVAKTNLIIIGTTRINYAKRHNEGLTDRLGRKMPKREFIGDSNELDKKNKALLIKMLAKVFKV